MRDDARITTVVNGEGVILLPEWALKAHYIDKDSQMVKRIPSGEYIISILNREELYRVAGWTRENGAVFDWAYPVDWAMQQEWWGEGSPGLVWAYETPEGMPDMDTSGPIYDDDIWYALIAQIQKALEDGYYAQCYGRKV